MIYVAMLYCIHRPCAEMNGCACSLILVTNFELRNANIAACECELGMMCEEHAQ